MKIRYCFFLMLMLTVIAASGQQSITISGKITGEHAEAVSNATVYLLNTNNAAISDSLRNFSMKNIRKGEYVIVVSAIGYATRNEPLIVSEEQNQHFEFKLANALTQLSAVIVSAEKKEDNLQHVPASISVLTSKDVDAYRLR